MNTYSERPFQLYKVVMDLHGYPFVRPVAEPLPLGWHEVGARGTQSECLGFIREIEAESPPTLPAFLSDEEVYSE